MAATAGVFLATQAAYGLPTSATWLPTFADLVAEDRLSARRSIQRLQIAIFLAGVAVTALTAAIGVIWYGS